MKDSDWNGGILARKATANAYAATLPQSRYEHSMPKDSLWKKEGRKKAATVGTCRLAPLPGVTPSYVKVWWDAAICFKMATKPLQVISSAADVARESRALHHALSKLVKRTGQAR